jgi:hypothetical protein
MTGTLTNQWNVGLVGYGEVGRSPDWRTEADRILAGIKDGKPRN